MEKAEEAGSSASSFLNKFGWLRLVFAMVALGGILGPMIWFLERRSFPVCYIEMFDISGLKQATNSSHNHNTIHFDIELKNRRSRDMGVHYDALNFTFYYKHNLTNHLIGNATINPFFQRFRHTRTNRNGNFEATGITWENVNAPKIFRVEVVTATRFQKLFWKTKRHHMVVGADIQVNDKGRLVKRKKLK